MELTDDELIRFEAEGLRFPDMPYLDEFLEHDGARLHFTAFGSGFPVILSHGGMGHAVNWAGQIADLVNAGFSVIAIDTRGHGQSSRNGKAFTYQLLASDILAVMDYLDIPKALLVGWSDGACSSLVLADRHPGRVAGVVYFACNMDPSGVHDNIEYGPILMRCVHRHEIDFVALSPTPAQFTELGQDLQAMQKSQPNYTRSNLERISVPVVIIQAEHDEFIKAEHALYLASAIPGAAFEHIDGVSHFAPIQRPARFNSVLLRYLNKFAPKDGRPFSQSER